MPRLVGERIILREYRKEDFPYIRKWVNDSEIVDFLSGVFVYPHTVNDTENFLNSMLEGEGPMKGFIICHKETEEYIGQIDLIKTDWINRVAGLGIVIGSKDNMNKGYGTEAIGLMQEFVFNRLNLNRLELEVRSYNKRAIAAYKKCGFKEEGRAREDFYIDGKYTDTIQMAILKREWEE